MSRVNHARGTKEAASTRPPSELTTDGPIDGRGAHKKSAKVRFALPPPDARAGAARSPPPLGSRRINVQIASPCAMPLGPLTSMESISPCRPDMVMM